MALSLNINACVHIEIHSDIIESIQYANLWIYISVFFREHSESQPKSAEWGTKKSAVFKPKLELMTVNIDGVWCPMLLKFRSIWLLISHFALIYMFMVKKNLSLFQTLSVNVLP